MFLLIISVYFLCIIVVERIQVELCKVFFSLSLLLTKHLGLQLMNLTTVCIFICFLLSTFHPLKLNSMSDFHYNQPTMNDNGKLGDRWQSGSLTEDWILTARETLSSKRMYLGFVKSGHMKNLTFFLRFRFFNFCILETGVHMDVSIRRVTSLLRSGILQREMIVCISITPKLEMKLWCSFEIF